MSNIRQTHYYLSFLILIAINACNKPNLEEESKNIKRNFETYLPVVTVRTIEKDTFFTEIISNGVLEAANKVSIVSQVAGRFNRFNLSNGSRVSAGQVLFTLENPDLQRALIEAEITYSQAVFDFKDRLTSYESKTGVFEDTLKMESSLVYGLKVQSGLISASLALKKAKEDLSMLSIRTPISGRVASLEAKPYNYTSQNEDVCIVLNDDSFEVVFSVLETELNQLQIGRKVQISPYAFQGTYTGTISEINPLVENGLVTVKARVSNNNGRLVDGLNVEVTIQNRTLDQIVVPKQAVVPRDGRKVVFTLEADTTVYWNYVTVDQENVGEYTITEGLEPGDQIVVTGNINLAHQSKVKLQGE